MIIETHAHATLLSSPYCPGSGTGIRKFPVLRPWATLAVPFRTSRYWHGARKLILSTLYQEAYRKAVH
jgi:hypothetical protein